MRVVTVLVLAGLFLPRIGVCQITISEIRIDQPGSDSDEYFELNGPPGFSLSAYTYVVIGDGASGGGVIESVTPLSEAIIPSDGYFVVVEESFTLGASADLVANLNFENGDNVTHLLVSGFSGSLGEDLDDDDDGVLEQQPWLQVVDCIALLASSPGNGDPTYCAQTIGPEGGVPWHIFRDGGWVVGEADVGEGDTPGGPVSSLPVEISSFRVLLNGPWVVLQWSTLQERNNAGFRVERLTAASVQDAIFVPANGADRGWAYAARMRRPPPGEHLVRLVQVDRDGTSTIASSATILVPVSLELTVGLPYPNPTYGDVRMTLSTPRALRLSGFVTDASGRTIKRLFDRSLDQGERYQARFSVDGFASGRYFIHVVSATGRMTRPIDVVH